MQKLNRHGNLRRSGSSEISSKQMILLIFRFPVFYNQQLPDLGQGCYDAIRTSFEHGF